MKLITFLLGLLFSLISTSIMSYISLATPIGPWIAPTLVLIGILFSKLLFPLTTYELTCAIAMGSIGGILATACAFSFPTLYFLDPQIFAYLMHNPLLFCATMSGLCLTAGLLAIIIAHALENDFLYNENLSFPIGALTHRMITTQQSIQKSYQLVVGFIITFIASLLQNKSLCTTPFIPSSFTILPAVRFSCIQQAAVSIPTIMLPMICAIGFVTGHVITIPLAMGAFIATFLKPVHATYFSYVSSTEFSLAFCSGIILFTTGMSIIKLLQKLLYQSTLLKKQSVYEQLKKNWSVIHSVNKPLSLCFIILFVLFFSFFKMSLVTQLYLVLCTIITTHQITYIAGQIGLALLGRFATFVMIPAMIFMNVSYTHLVFIATFVEVCGGIGADLFFNRKLALLSDVPLSHVKKYQQLGILVSSIVIGIIFWLLINHFTLGSPALCAYRAQSRQLLIQAQVYDWYIITLGGICSYLLTYLKLNPTLVLGGILMPLEITVGLIAGGLLTYATRDKEEWYPFWSGVFASNSLYMILQAILK